MSDSLPASGEALEVASATAGIAKRLGVAAAVAVNFGEGLSVGVRNGEVETLEHHRDKRMSVTVYAGQRKGSATTTDFSLASLTETVEAARRIAEFTEPDACAGLIEARYLARDIPDLELDHPWGLSPDAAIALAQTCDAAARAAHPEVAQVDEAGVSHYRGLHAYATSEGFAAAYPASRHGINCVVVGARDGAMQRGYWYTVARDPAVLEDAAGVGRTAAARTVAKLGARKLSTRTAPVLFEARVATGLIGHLVAACSGGNLYREASFLRDALGTRILPPFLTIEELPHLARALGSAPFDGEGAATRARTVVDAGVLQGFFLDSYSARRLGREPTGNAGGAHNLVVSDQGADFAALMKTLDRGLLVTDLMGHGTNLLTGDYSRGASGFWVERGEVAYPVEEITIAGNLREMFARIVATGQDRELRGSVRCGSILIEEMTIAGD